MTNQQDLKLDSLILELFQTLSDKDFKKLLIIVDLLNT